MKDNNIRLMHKRIKGTNVRKVSILEALLDDETEKPFQSIHESIQRITQSKTKNDDCVSPFLEIFEMLLIDCKKIYNRTM